jgi:AraC-like DNA-binding protein
MSTNNFNYEFFQSAIDMDLQLYYCGVEDCAPGHNWGPGVKDHYKIHYVNSGKGAFTCGGQTYTLGKGEAFIIHPNIPSYYIADQDEPWTYSWVAFNGIHAELYLKRIQLSHENPIIRCNAEQEVQIQECFNQMFQASHHESSKDMRLLSSLYTFLAIIGDTLEPETTNHIASNMKEHYINQAMGYIEANYSHSIKIEDLAKELNLNRKYMSKLFKELVGMTPQNYLVRFRMNKACNLMKNTSLHIGEIALSVGYPDQLLFSRMFKSTIGIAPTQYRKSFKETDAV